MPTEPQAAAPPPSTHEIWTEEGIVTLSRYEVDNVLVALCLNYAGAADRRPVIAKLLATWTSVYNAPGQKWSLSLPLLRATLNELGAFANSIIQTAPTSFRIYVNLYNKLNVRAGISPASALPTTTRPVVEKKGRRDA